ncbi:MAG TPA: hypothetical protein VFO34_13280 [Candidatus Acidoferrales bacterium]|nr:hypothetical protein [Candidatus Acidoferrales bacterium]
MPRRSPRWMILLPLILIPAVLVAPRLVGNRASAASPNLTVHEWGTFTSVAGRDGAAVEWLPLTGSTDLPKFVEHLGTAAFKTGLRGTVRMETPVLYFYSPRETNVSVKVGFKNGVITEWYPHASDAPSASAVMNASLSKQRPDGSIGWASVAVRPTAAPDFPRDNKENHYYAARETSANPIEIETPSGNQREKFLFYRGVASFAVPIFAHVNSGESVQLENRSGVPVPAILFERRGEKVGYRTIGEFTGRTTVQSSDLSGGVDALGSEIEGLLVTQGLYADEAHAMVKTWRDSWFEEGSRILYLVPRQFIDSVLPLSIRPAPSNVTRAFVGRLELVTPATERAVAAALANNDRAALSKFGRFLEPILTTMKAGETDPQRIRMLQKELDSVSATEETLELQARR